MYYNNSNFNSLPAHNKSRSIDKPNLLRSQSPFVPTQPPILDSASSSSSSLRSTNTTNNIIIPSLKQKNGPRRPSTSHATLQIPISSADPTSSFFRPHLSRPTHSQYQNSIHASVRSLSPLARRKEFSPSNQIVQSSSFSHLGRLTPSYSTLNSTFGLSSTQPNPTPQTNQFNSLGRKRDYDRMSISPIRPNQSPESRSQSYSLFPNDPQANKKQMIRDPELGFVTVELRDKILRENELKLRQELGRPFPDNEAEKILQVLETGPSLNPFLKPKRQLPSIPVPIPSSAPAQRRNPAKTLNGSNGVSTNLEALIEEQAIHSNPTIIAPISKKMDAERIKRLADKKGTLRMQVRRQKMVEESKRKRDTQALEYSSAPNDSAPSNHPTQRPDHSALRSASVETASELASPPRRRSSRKIGKLTSQSSKAKVNQGRKSRSQSVNEDETNENHQDRVGLARGSAQRASAPNGTGMRSNSKSLEVNGKAYKSRRSPSPIQEEDEDLANRSEHHKAPVPAPQHTTTLHPAVRSSSISLQTPSSMVKSASTSSLRPGRTFTSRRHAKARVFSALEEDLPPLNDEDDEEADLANEKLKKIKLPSTFLSSFKLDKFTPPPQADVQPAMDIQETQDPSSTSHQASPKKSLPQSDKPSLFGQFAAPDTTTSAPSAAPTTEPSTIGTSFLSNSKGENQVESTNPPALSSTFFSLPKNNEPVQSDNQSTSTQQPIALFGGFSRIPSDKPPPNFFGGITTTTATTTATQPASLDASISQPQPNTSDQQTEKNPSSGLFSFQVANPSGATTTTSSSSSAGLFKFTSDSNSITPASSSVDAPNVIAESKETNQSKPPLFAFGAQTGSQLTTGVNDSAVTPNPITSAATPANEPTKISDSQPPSSVPAFTFGGGTSNPPASIFGSQPEPTSTAPDQMKPDPVPSVTTAAFSPSTFAFGNSQPSSTSHQITNTQSSGSVQSGMFGMMDSATQPTPSPFGNSNSTAPASNPLSSTSGGFNFNVSTKPTTETPFGVASSSQQSPSPFVFGASTASTTNHPVPTQPAVGSGLFGASSPAAATAPPISFSFGSTSSSSNNTSSPFVFGANTSTGLTSTPTPSFGQPPSTNTNAPASVFNFGAGNSSSSTTTTATQNQNPASNGMFGFNNQTSVDRPPNSNTSFNFGGTSQSFNNNGSTGTSLFGNSNGGVTSPTTNLFGNSNNLNLNNGGLTGTNNKTGVFGGGGSLFGSSSAGLSMNNGDNSNSNMMETQTISTPTFGGGGGGSNGNLGGFGSSNGTNPSPFNFGGNPNPITNTNNNSVNFGMGGGATSTMNSGMTNSNSGIVNPPTPLPPAPGGFVFNMGSSGTNNTTPGSSSGRNIRKLPAVRKVKR